MFKSIFRKKLSTQQHTSFKTAHTPFKLSFHVWTYEAHLKQPATLIFFKQLSSPLLNPHIIFFIMRIIFGNSMKNVVTGLIDVAKINKGEKGA
jgi:hypothetical protein